MKTQSAKTIPPRPANSDAPSIIGPNVLIEGDLKTESEVQLDGTVRGNLECSHLAMGETGVIEGRISAETATIRGRVSGNIHARTVRLEASAVIEGDVYHASLTVEAGAKLSGTYTNSDDPLNELQTPPKAPPRLADQSQADALEVDPVTTAAE